MCNNKKDVPYLDVISLFVTQPSTFNSTNSQYLEVFGFNLINFMCFGDKRNLWNENYSVFHKSQWSFSSSRNKFEITITTDTTIY